MTKNRRGGGRRVEKIFQMFDLGYNNVQINQITDDDRRRGEESRQKGIDSELNAKRAISKLYYVNRVKLNDRYGGHDYLSHDLTVFLDLISCLSFLEPALAIPHGQVFVQVVSSQIGIKRFRDETIMRLDGGEEKYRHYLNDEKLIVLNGQLPDSEIQDFFTQQLIELNLAWVMR